jgi:hypothetical protein
MRAARRLTVILLLCAGLLLATASAASAAQPPVNLGTSASYGVFAHRTITNAGTTYVTGDLGIAENVLPGPGIVVSGATNLGNPAAVQALADVEAAYADALARTPATTISGNQIGNRTLLPGVYQWQVGQVMDWYLDGTLTLDAQGDPNAVWVFQCPPILHAMTGSRVNLVNGARFCRVFWQTRVADLQPGCEFAGHILASESIAMGHGATMRGQLLAMGNVEAYGDIALDDNRIDNSICATWTPSLPKTGYPPVEPSIPWTSALAALAAAVLTLLLIAGRRATTRG